VRALLLTFVVFVLKERFNTKNTKTYTEVTKEKRKNEGEMAFYVRVNWSGDTPVAAPPKNERMS